MINRRHLLPFIVMLATSYAAPGVARSEPASIADVALQIDAAERSIDAVTAVDGKPADDTTLAGRVETLQPADRALDTAVATLTPRLAAIDARLGELGPVAAAGQPTETAELAAERAKLLRDRTAVAAETKQAGLLIVELDQLVVRLQQERRALFARDLWASGQSLLNPDLWRSSVAAMPADLRRLSSAGTAEAHRAVAARGNMGWLFVGLLLALAVIASRGQLLAVGRRRAEQAGSRIGWALLTLWHIMVVVGTVVAGAFLVRAGLTAVAELTPAFAAMMTIIVQAVAFAAFVDGLGTALLAPGYPAGRLIPLDDGVALALRRFPGILGITVAVAGIAGGVHRVFGTSLVNSVVSDSFALCLELVVIVTALTIAGRKRAPGAEHPHGAQLPWIIAALATWLGLIAAAIAVVVGYLALANFIMREIVWIAVVLASLFVLVRIADDLFPALLRPTSRLGRAIIVAVGVSPTTLAQVGILLSGLARVALLLVGWTLVVAPFGADASDIFGRVTSADLVIHVGATSISPDTILGGILIFAVGLGITRGVRGWFEARYLPATPIDVGVRTSLVSAVSYLGAIMAIVVASIFLGVSLDRIALFASALSIGIGFGLQSIISNFVSGLILLVERPVKVGDWIAIGDLEGDVRKVNVRATEIEMKDQSRLIVPNLDLITKTVRNVTHAGALGRARIVFRVNDDADPNALRTLLLDVLAAHPEVLKEPGPAVYLTDANNGGLEFTIFAFVASARDVYRVRSDLLFAIVPALKTRGFALANSTPIVNLGVDGRLIEPSTVRR